MSNGGRPKVAVIGVGEVGRGWAALTTGSGWSTAIFDTDAKNMNEGQDDILRRVEMLVGAGRIDRASADVGLGELRTGRSLLQAVGEADWIIEALPDDLQLKQRTLEQIEQVARARAVITSSSANHFTSQLCGRLRNPSRLLVANPMVPVELLPLVEVVPGPLTDSEAIESVRQWLKDLRRAPIVLEKEVPGHVVGRLIAAVWRESIQLVLDGVVDVQTMDAAVQLGPGLAWAAAGPHLNRALEAKGDADIGGHVSERLAAFEESWKHLAKWDQLASGDRQRIQRAIEKAYAGRLTDLRAKRGFRVISELEEADEGPTGGWSGELSIVRPPDPR